MTFFRKFISRQWLKHGVMLALGVIASSMLLFITGTPAPKPAYFDRLVSLMDQDRDRLVAIFKDIHQNPELGFMETRTAGIVAKELKALGYDVKAGIGKTGVVGILQNGDGPKVMFRADMDSSRRGDRAILR